jgi:comEA protein
MNTFANKGEQVKQQLTGYWHQHWQGGLFAVLFLTTLAQVFMWLYPGNVTYLPLDKTANGTHSITNTSAYTVTNKHETLDDPQDNLQDNAQEKPLNQVADGNPYQLRSTVAVKAETTASPESAPDDNTGAISMLQLPGSFDAPSHAAKRSASTHAQLTHTQLTNVIAINSASAQSLEKLPGIGPKLAQRIISYRASHGPFNTLQDLDNVKGVGPKMLAHLAPLISF